MAEKVLITDSVYDEDLKIFHGIKVPNVYSEECSIGRAVVEALLLDPDHISQICYPNGLEYTNKEIATLTIYVAQNLQKLNIKQGDVIGLCAANSDFIAPLVFGALSVGLIISTLDPSFDKDGIKHIFSITKPKIMFCDGSIYHVIKEVFEECNLTNIFYTINEHVLGVAHIDQLLVPTGSENQFNFPTLEKGYKQIAMILCSSGTTGLPKGVCMTHMSLLNNLIFRFNRDDKLLCFSTLYWLTGLICLIDGSISNSTRVISKNGYIPEEFVDIVNKHKVTALFSPPSQMAITLNFLKSKSWHLQSIKVYLCGGSTVPYSLVEKLKVYMPNATFVTGYGMSEVCGPICLSVAKPSGTVGKIVKNVEVKIIDEKNISLGVGKSGEICIRRNHHWPGYYDNAAATTSIYDNEYWIHSGDIGYLNENCELFIVDRIKDIMKYNNFHVSPAEIESVIHEIPDVSEVCVFGIPDVVSTHLPAAAVVKVPNSSLNKGDVYRYVAEKMTHFKHLRGGVYFLNHLPKTASGKYLRYKIADMCLNMRTDSALKH